MFTRVHVLCACTHTHAHTHVCVYVLIPVVGIELLMSSTHVSLSFLLTLSTPMLSHKLPEAAILLLAV